MYYSGRKQYDGDGDTESSSTASLSTVTGTTDFTVEDESSIATQSLQQRATQEGQGDVTSVLPLDAKKLTPERERSRYLGVLYTVYGISMTSLGSSVLSVLSHVHPITITVYSVPVGIFTSAPFIWYRNKVARKPVMDTLLPLSQHKKIIFFMWLRSTCMVVLTLCLARTAPFSPVTDSRTIMAASSVTVNILGWLWFEEKIGITTVAAILFSLCGVAIMTKTPFLTGRAPDSDSNVDIVALNWISVSSMLCSSSNMLLLRYLNHIYHGLRNTFLFTWAFLSTLPFAIYFDKMTIPAYTSWDIAAIMGYGMLLAFNNTYFAWALGQDEAGTVALVRTSEFSLGIIWQMILFKVYPDWISLLGGCLSLTGIIVVILRKWLQGREEDHPVRLRLQWLLS